MSNSVDADPAFSVIVPTFQRNELLAKCLGCLAPGQQKAVRVWTLKQTSDALGQMPGEITYEVIVADDGRQTTAQAMIRERFPWARWIAGPKVGPAANRNAGAEAAKGEWLVFTDDDCLPESTWLAGYGNAISQSIADVYEGATYTEEANKGAQWTAPVNTSGGCLWSCNFAIKRSVFQELGGFDSAFPYPHLEDVDLRERLRAAGHEFPFCKDAAVFHPLRPIGSVLREALFHKSYFYYARKHGKSLREAGFSPIIFVKARLRRMKNSVGLVDFVGMLWRLPLEAILITLFGAYWWIKSNRQS